MRDVKKIKIDRRFPALYEAFLLVRFTPSQYTPLGKFWWAEYLMDYVFINFFIFFIFFNMS